MVGRGFINIHPTGTLRRGGGRTDIHRESNENNDHAALPQRRNGRLCNFGQSSSAAHAITLASPANVPVERCNLTLRFDIFKKDTGDSFLWVEAVKDIGDAQTRLISLTSGSPADYRLFDQSLQQFVNPFAQAANQIFSQ
jgi:hypothetical protein